MKRVDALPSHVYSGALLCGAVVAGALCLIAAIDPLLHFDHVVSGTDPWLTWPVTPGMTLPLALAGWVYVMGQRSIRAAEIGRHERLRHLAFFGGLAALFIALQSPIEPISDHLFVAHQVEHMLLRTGAPMLLMLAAPQAALLRGLPEGLRRYVVAPVLRSRAVRALGILGHPLIATVLFIGTTYFWMIPRYHDIAILDEPIHYLWHTTLLLSGLIFFWRILDPRPYPLGASLGARLFMFWIASVGNILLGSYLTFKHQVLYHAYDEMGRLWIGSAATDETYGGLIMWIPGSMMFTATAMLMIYRWGREEERLTARRNGANVVVSGPEFVAQKRNANRRTAVGLLCFSATVLVITFTTVLIYHYPSIGARFGLGAFGG
jgi:putative membrane protein